MLLDGELSLGIVQGDEHKEAGYYKHLIVLEDEWSEIVQNCCQANTVCVLPYTARSYRGYVHTR